MGLFNFFGNRKNEMEADQKTIAIPETTTSTVDNTSTPTFTVSYATGWPIDAIYGNLFKDYSEQGYEDAMIKSDMAFMSKNSKIIKSRILMKFREINLNYDTMKEDLETRMKTCSDAGLLETVAEMQKTMNIISNHKEELERLEKDFREGLNEAAMPIETYECGFLRGIAAIALGGKKGTGITESEAFPTIGNMHIA